MFITVIQISLTEAIIARFRRQRGVLEFCEGTRQLLAEKALGEILPLWRAKCQADRVILALPPSFFSMREMELPLTDRKKAREIISLELKGETAVDSDELIFEAIMMAEGRCQAIWCSASLLAPRIALLAEHGLDPEIVTSSLFCWNHLLPAGAQEPVALADNEAFALYAGGRPVYFRALPQHGDRRIAATLAAVEMSKGIAADRVTAVGGELLAEGGVELAHLQAGGAFSAAFNADPQAARDLASAYASACALLSGDPVNFRRAGLTFTRRRSELLKRLRITAALTVVALVLLFAEAALRYRLISKDLASLNSSIGKIYSQAFPKRTRPVDEVAELRAEIKRLGATSSDGVLLPLKLLAEAKNDDLNELYEIEIDGNQVTGKGGGRSVQAVNDFKAKAATFFADMEVREIKSRADGSTGFSFRATLKDGGK